jgi:site-specific DNA-methyltransferase (adenine-specific)
MKMEDVQIPVLKENDEFRDFYSLCSVGDLVDSYQQYGQQNPIHINSDMEIINGYRMVEAIKQCGGTTVMAIIMDGNPGLQQRIALNKYRIKTTADEIKEARVIIQQHPKRQGQKPAEGNNEARYDKISRALGNRWKGDVMINKLEHVLDNDLEDDYLSKGIFENRWKVDPCYDFLKNKMAIDKENGYGYTEKLLDGTYTISEVNKFITQRHELDQNNNKYTFVIPEKANSYCMDCLKFSKMIELQKQVDLIITSIPYWDLRNYEEGKERQLGQEETKEEYARNIARIFGELYVILKDTANVIINIGETYKNGVAQGIPYLIKEFIEKETSLIYKETIIWSKKNPRPQGEKVRRPANSIEFCLWFVVNPEKSKYNLLTFPAEGKKAKVVSGSKDVASSGKVSKKTKSISKPYQKMLNHWDEQQVENIIITCVGKNHEIFKISEQGHPAAMSPMLPVTLTLMLSDEHDLVCDPFGGANVVGKCALELNRRYVSAELSKRYFDTGCEMLRLGDRNFNRQDLDKINELVYPQYNYYYFPIAA